MPLIRRGEAGDLAAVAAIQRASPEAAQWDVAGYLSNDFLVAADASGIAGFVVARTPVEGESEILNIAVAPEFRRRGVARELVSALPACSGGTVFLEVRESNQAARSLYKSMAFEEVGRRDGYYDNPPETAIVMKFHSC